MHNGDSRDDASLQQISPMADKAMQYNSTLILHFSNVSTRCHCLPAQKFQKTNVEIPDVGQALVLAVYYIDFIGLLSFLQLEH